MTFVLFLVVATFIFSCKKRYINILFVHFIFYVFKSVFQIRLRKTSIFLIASLSHLRFFKILFVMVVERFGENMKVIVKILAFSTDNRLLKVPWYNLDKIICRTELHGHLCVKVPLQMYIFILISEYSIQCTCRIIFQHAEKKKEWEKDEG